MGSPRRRTCGFLIASQRTAVFKACRVASIDRPSVFAGTLVSPKGGLVLLNSMSFYDAEVNLARPFRRAQTCYAKCVTRTEERPCDGSSKLRGRNAQPRPPPRRCWVRPDWGFRCSVVHRDPRCPLLISRNLTIPRPISASFLAKRKCKTSVSPRFISSIRKTLAAPYS